ncbi:MAG TPA: serine/threonine-protein kinase [Ktedonobacterales bacterium]|nr:serine/threonine-protein kinase [Ktedonobacterales bacterium]
MTLEGASFDGYRLLRLLGRGGAGEVYLADSPANGPVMGQVALKLYHDARNELVAQELMRQTQLAASLKHPNILPCYNNAIQGNDLAIVMAYAPGGSLGDTLNASHSSVTLPLRPTTAASLIAQVARTLADIHTQGLTHGDLKPTNLFVRTAADGSPIVAISDFGHAFLAQAAVAALLHPGPVPPEWAVEQLAWAAPEQLRGDLAVASDQYSLAALAYYLLTGIRPISAEAQRIMSGNAPRAIIPPSRLNPALDDEIDAVLLHALAPLPRQRFGDVLEFARALDDTLSAGEAASSAGKIAPPSTKALANWSESMVDRPTKRTLAHMGFSNAAGSSARNSVRRVAVPAPSPQRSRLKRMLRVSAGPEVSGPLEATETSETWDYATDDLRRRITRIAALVLLAALVIGVLGTLVFGNLRARLNPSSLTGPSVVPTAQSSPTPASAAQSQAESRLRAALGGKPVYSDTLTGTPAQWTVNGKTIFFGADHRLHLLNGAKTPLFANMPINISMPKGAYVASVDATLIKGAASGHAGLRFLASTAQKGDTYYSYLITQDGRFELWLQQPSTGLVFLTSGSVPSLKQGVGQTNTLAVLVDPTAKMLTLFANGAFIFQIPIPSGVAMTGRAGMLTPDDGVEAAFANFAIYNA